MEPKIFAMERGKVNLAKTVQLSTSLLATSVHDLEAKLHQELTLESPVQNQEMEVDLCGDVIRKELWVDKYASQRYFDLLTDDFTNRKVMTWLKSWDEIIFPDRPKLNLAPPDLNQKKQTDPFYIKKLVVPFESEHSFSNK